MPTFEFETANGSWEIEAPDEATALSAFQQHVMGGAKPQADLFGSKAFDAVAARQQAGEPGALRRGVLSGELMDSGRPQPQQPSAQPPMNAFSAASAGSRSGALFGFDDEIAAGMLAPIEATKNWAQGKGFDLGGAYSELQQDFDARKDAVRDAHPVAATVGEVAGGAMLAGNAAKAGLSLVGRTAGKGLGTRVAAGAGEGAAYGAAYGAGEADQGERMEGAATGAAIGALTGGLIEGGAGAVQKAISNRASRAAVVSSEQLKEAARPLYEQSKQSGLVVRPSAYRKALGSLQIKLKDFAFDPALNPRTSVVVQRMADALDNPNLSLVELDNLRKMAGNAARTADGSDRAAAGIIIDEIDDIVADAANFKVGNSQGLKDLQEARGLWKRAKKTEMLEDAFEGAELAAASSGSGGNINNATRQKIKAILTNKKKARMFSDAEQTVMREIVKGTKMENILRLAGKLSPGGNGLMTFMMGGASTVLPQYGIPAMAIGGAAKRMSDGMTQGNAQRLIQGVSTGVMPSRNVALPRSVTQPLIPGATSSIESFRR